MSAYNFRPMWEGALIKGSKGTTIRADRKDGRVPKVGDIFDAYVGMRTKNCRLLFRSVITKVMGVEMSLQPPAHKRDSGARIVLGKKLLGPIQADRFAYKDGFWGVADDMLPWFQKMHGLPFKGWVIEWAPWIENLYDILALAGLEAPHWTLIGWTGKEQVEAADYAIALHLLASDNDDVKVPPVPMVIMLAIAEKAALKALEPATGTLADII